MVGQFRIATKLTRLGIVPLISFLSVIATVSAATAQSSTAVRAAANDFNGDGLSDFILLTINKNGSLSWDGFATSVPSITSLGTLGNVGDHIAVAPWNTSSIPALGVVTKSGSSVSWIVNSNGNLQQLALGSPDSTVIAGADLNGNGVADAIAVTKEGSALTWEVQLDPFSLSPGARTSFRFGKSKDIPFFFSLGGTSDVVGLLRQKGKFTTLLYRSLDGRVRKRRVLRNVPSGVDRPLPVKATSGKDLLGFSFVRSGETRVKLLDAAGRSRGSLRFAGTGTLLVGDFVDGFGEEVALYSEATGTAQVVNPRSKYSATIDIGDGIPVDEININSFQNNSSSPTNSPSSGGDSSSSCPAVSAPAGQCQQKSAKDGNEGFLWKPNSDTMFYAVMLMPREYTGCTEKVETVTTGGTVINELAKKAGTPNGGREGFQDFKFTGKTYKNQYGRIAVRATMKRGGCIEYAIDNPASRTD